MTEGSGARREGLADGVVALPGLLAAGFLAAMVGWAWLGRIPYPYDLEWMEGGMLAHAWRLEHGLPLYVTPGPEWVPYVYPPGYSALLAALPGPPTYLGGRLISVAGTLAAAVGLMVLAARLTRTWLPGAMAALAFLATYTANGAFFDLVRPDALALALLAWALVLCVDRRRGAEIAGGLLLAAAFTVKHNYAAFGVPILVLLVAERGVRVGGRFTLASAAPALLFVGLMQWRSHGLFLTYLLEVPSSHPMVWSRGIPGSLWELGSYLLPVLVVAGVGAPLALARAHRGAPAIAIGVAAVALGVVGAWVFGRHPRVTGVANPDTWIAAVTGASLGALVAAAVLGSALALASKRSDRSVAWSLGVLGVALVLCVLMRAHHGGFLNVLIPGHWAVCLAGAVGFAALWQRLHGGLGAALQLLWLAPPLWLLAGPRDGLAGKNLLDGELWRLIPTEDDQAMGDAAVEALVARCDGPILSPYAPWLSVRAGQSPGPPLIALWDVQHKAGPLPGTVAALTDAVREQHWACIVEGGGRPLPYKVPAHYTHTHTFEGRSSTWMPKSGWRVRPTKLWTPSP